MHTQIMEYKDSNTCLKSFIAYDDKIAGKRPAVIICHDWSGRNEFADNKAIELAKLGYVGFALDIYGEGKIGKDNDEKSKMMQPFMEERALLRQRLLAAYHEVAKLPEVDAQKIGVIGFCFGGLCAIDLARSGAALCGVVAFHGFFNAPANLPNKTISAKILAFHGNNDPMIPAQQIQDFAKEMATANVDWQVHVFGNTMHAFTNPLANDPAFGTVYNPVAAQRSWQGMLNFFNEVFA